MSAILRNRRMQLLRRVSLGTVAAVLFLPNVSSAISWSQVASYFDGGTYVKGKFYLGSNSAGSSKRLKYKAVSDIIPLSDGLSCTYDEVVCVSTALFNFAGAPAWVDIITRPDGSPPPKIYRYVDICLEMPALCAPGVTIVGGFMNFCYAPDPTTLPPPAFTISMASSVCEGAYVRPMGSFPPSPSTPVIIY